MSMWSRLRNAIVPSLSEDADEMSELRQRYHDGLDRLRTATRGIREELGVSEEELEARTSIVNQMMRDALRSEP
jgi:hypothetical protein